MMRSLVATLLVAQLAALCVTAAQQSYVQTGRSTLTFASHLARAREEAGLQTQGTTSCPDITCLGQNGDCSQTSDTVEADCPANQNLNGTITSCRCESASMFQAAGSVCTRNNDCAATQYIVEDGETVELSSSTCSTHPHVLEAVSTKHCFANGFIGDTCTTAYDCGPPRVCTNGICSADLTVGAPCLNLTVFGQLGMCPLGSYCYLNITDIFHLTTACHSYLPRGAACEQYPTCVDILSCTCDPSLYCDLNTLTCTTPTPNVLATGQRADNDDYCASTVRNTTTNVCIDYNVALATIQPVIGTTCDPEQPRQCNGIVQACQCTQHATGNAATCQGPPVPTATTIAINRAFYGLMNSAYAAGCEIPFDTAPNACAVRKGFYGTFLSTVCPYTSAYSTQGIVSCRNPAVQYGCSGSGGGSGTNGSSLGASSIGVLALVAMFMAVVAAQ